MKFRVPGPSVGLAIILVAAVLVLSGVSVAPTFKTVERQVSDLPGQGGLAAGDGSVIDGSGVGGSSATAGGKAGAAGRAGLQCAAGKNGGSTDSGVSGNSIKLGATVVRSGIGAAFLGGAPVAMEAVVEKVNGAGGVCGRLLDLKMLDDGWDATRGVTFLRSLIDQGVFAIAVSPSSEGVNALITAGDLRKKGVPLVGADGMVKSQYTDPWVWAVATSTVSTMHIVAQETCRRMPACVNERKGTVGIVFESDYHFGKEGAKAYNAAVERVTGRPIPGFDASLTTCKETFCAIPSGQPSYSTQVQTFNSACNRVNPNSALYPQADPPSGALPSCDIVVLLLEPKTALTWLTNGGAAPAGRTHGPQPLFNEDFAKQCDARCNAMEVWTSYNPPLAPYIGTKAIGDYRSTVRAVDPSLDVSNSFTQGAYLGMNVLVESLKRLGPNVTRAGLKQVLDSGAYDFGISQPQSWRASNHLGTGQMQSYILQYQGNTFIAFAHKSGFVADSMLGKDLDD